VTYTGFYINLDRSTGRRTEIEGEISRYGLSHLYRRFPAADGNILNFPNPHLSNSEIGCFTSHLLLLQQNMASVTHLHVVEDDAVFSRFTGEILNVVSASDTIDQHDILFTETFITPLNLDYKACKEIYDKSIDRDAVGRVTQVRPSIINFVAGTSSYLVNRRSIPKLVELFSQVLKSGAPVNVDLVIREAAKAGKIRVGCIFPFVTTIKLEGVTDNTIHGRTHDSLTEVLAGLGRGSFFVDCDRKALAERAERLLPLPNGDDHLRLLGHLLAFSLTDKFHPY
jgi:GR25 family glycosyltransferase involved in LPS biosynthesis